MTLHTREFTVNGQKIIVGHDRETGKRYYVDGASNCWDVNSITLTEFVAGENFISIDTSLGELVLFSDIENPEKVVIALKSIFWIE